MSDDDIEVLEECSNHGGGGWGGRSGGGGPKDRFGRNFKYHFIFSTSIPEDERRDLHSKIRKLHGYSTGSIFYTQEATHCVAPDRTTRSPLAVFGCLADHRKKLVNPAYIRDSFEEGLCLPDTEESHFVKIAWPLQRPEVRCITLRPGRPGSICPSNMIL